MHEIGMDADQVRAFAAKVDSQASLISAVISTVNSLVGQLPHVWVGSDASEFVGWWMNKHRPALQSALDSITGLATSARNNADAQDLVSGVSTGTPPGQTSLTGGDPASRLLDFALNGTSATQQASAGWSAQANAQGSTHFGAIPLSGDAHAQAFANATEQSHATLSKDGAEAGVTAAVGVGATAAASGRIGNDMASLDGNADASVGADAKGSASAAIGLDGADLKGDAGAFVGGQVDGNVSGQVGGVGVGLGGHAYAGAGVHVGGEAQIGLDETKVSLSLGAALGVGAGVDVTFDVKPEQVLDDIGKVLRW